MKRTFLLLLIIYGLFFSKGVIVTQAASNVNFSVPGWTCGVADDPQKNKCCQVNYPQNLSHRI